MCVCVCVCVRVCVAVMRDRAEDQAGFDQRWAEAARIGSAPRSGPAPLATVEAPRVLALPAPEEYRETNSGEMAQAHHRRASVSVLDRPSAIAEGMCWAERCRWIIPTNRPDRPVRMGTAAPRTRAPSPSPRTREPEHARHVREDAGSRVMRWTDSPHALPHTALAGELRDPRVMSRAESSVGSPRPQSISVSTESPNSFERWNKSVLSSPSRLNYHGKDQTHHNTEPCRAPYNPQQYRIRTETRVTKHSSAPSEAHNRLQTTDEHMLTNSRYSDRSRSPQRDYRRGASERRLEEPAPGDAAYRAGSGQNNYYHSDYGTDRAYAPPNRYGDRHNLPYEQDYFDYNRPRSGPRWEDRALYGGRNSDNDRQLGYHSDRSEFQREQNRPVYADGNFYPESGPNSYVPRHARMTAAGEW